MHFKQKIGEAIAPYHLLIEKKITESLSLFGPKSPLSDACAYALKNGGKRFRPALVLIIAKSLQANHPSQTLIDAALAIEYFHTASLIADDLPCMDDDDERRECPSLHKAFNETIALLATYALISAGYDKIRTAALEQNELLSLALASATYNTGIFGATGGQLLDLYPPEEINSDLLAEVIQKKTGTLFELSFVFGWLFGGGDPQQLPLVKKSAAHFGTAFQIVDDFLDYEEDLGKERKINAAIILGKEKAYEVLERELEELERTLGVLNLHSQELSDMIGALSPYTCASSSSS